MEQKKDIKQHDPDPSFAMESVRKLAGIVAHDFNNVLTGVLGFSMLMQQEMEEDNEFVRYAKEIEKAAIKGRELTDTLMAMSKKKALTKETVNIDELVTSCQEKLGCLTREERAIYLDLGGVVEVEVDPDQFMQALKNIVINAAGITKGGGKISIETRKVSAGAESLKKDPSLTESQDYMLINVRARGKAGIDPEDLEHIFQPYQGKGRDLEAGCGLTIARDIMKDHGGALAVDTNGNEEIIYSLWLPSSCS